MRLGIWTCGIKNKAGQEAIISWSVNGTKILQNAQVNAVSIEKFDGKQASRLPLSHNERLMVNETPRLFIR